jgi:hypothetical protein
MASFLVNFDLVMLAVAESSPSGLEELASGSDHEQSSKQSIAFLTIFFLTLPVLSYKNMFVHSL